MLLSPVFTAHYQGQLLGRRPWTPTASPTGVSPSLPCDPSQLWLRSGPARAAPKHHISAALPRQIRFGLFPFRSPLLGKSRLISLPRGTKMLQFPRFDLRRSGVRNCAGLPLGHLGIVGCVHLPRAYRSLPRPSSLLKPSNPPTAVFAPAYQPHITRLCAMIIAAPPCEGGGLHPSYATLMAHCIRCMREDAAPPARGPGGAVRAPANRVRGVTKEVIRPQVPLRSPCYDFSLVTYLKFDSANRTPPR